MENENSPDFKAKNAGRELLEGVQLFVQYGALRNERERQGAAEFGLG
jgi:hypothetical protein